MSSALCLRPLTVSNPSIFPTTNTKLPCETKKPLVRSSQPALLTHPLPQKLFSGMLKGRSSAGPECLTYRSNKSQQAGAHEGHFPHGRARGVHWDHLQHKGGQNWRQSSLPPPQKAFPTPRIALKVSEGKRRRGGNPRYRVGDVHGGDSEYL